MMLTMIVVGMTSIVFLKVDDDGDINIYIIMMIMMM